MVGIVNYDVWKFKATKTEDADTKFEASIKVRF